MTAKVPKSLIKDEATFKSAVEAFRQAKLAHRLTENEPAPTADFLIEASVRRVPAQGINKPDDFVADYVIVDDIPKPTVTELRAKLMQQSHQQEADDIAKVLSPAAQRLLQLELAEIGPKPPAEFSAEEQALVAKQQAFMTDVRKIQIASARRAVAIEAMTDDEVMA